MSYFIVNINIYAILILTATSESGLSSADTYTVNFDVFGFLDL